MKQCQYCKIDCSLASSRILRTHNDRYLCSSTKFDGFYSQRSRCLWLLRQRTNTLQDCKSNGQTQTKFITLARMVSQAKSNAESATRHNSHTHTHTHRRKRVKPADIGFLPATLTNLVGHPEERIAHTRCVSNAGFLNDSMWTWSLPGWPLSMENSALKRTLSICKLL